MTDLSLSDLLQTLEESVLGGSEEWHRSVHAFDRFDTSGTRDHAHRSFAIGLPSSGRAQGRQKGCVVLQTVVGVRYAYRLRADRQALDMRDAVDAERSLLDLLYKARTSAGPLLNLSTIGRSVTADGTALVTTILFDCLHVYVLTR